MSPYAWEITLSRFNECVRGQLMFGYVSPADAVRFDEYSEHIEMWQAPNGILLTGTQTWHSKQHLTIQKLQ